MKRIESKEVVIPSVGEVFFNIIKVFVLLNIINFVHFIMIENESMIELILQNFQNGFVEFIQLFKYAFLSREYKFNFLVIFSIYLIVNAIFNKNKISFLIVSLITFLISIMNFAVLYLRGTAITLYDIISIKTAANVTQSLSVDLFVFMLPIILLAIITIIIINLLNRKNIKKIYITRIVEFVIGIFIVIYVYNSSVVTGIYIYKLEETYSDKGIYLTVFKLIRSSKLEIPENYNKEEVEKLLSQYKVKNTDSNEENDNINIIAIMSESFNDYSVQENAKKYILEDNMPYLHELQKDKNVIYGSMHSSGFGGGTANIEYEYLTRNSTTFLPTGAIPYQLYLNKKNNSIVKEMNNNGYTTYAMHLWYKSGYSRELAYKLLGFNYSKFKEDFEDLEYTKLGYTKDISTYQKIIEILENKKDDEKIFSFNVTMQNHVSYRHEIEGYKKYSEEDIFNVYLQQEKLSDEALEYLIEYLKQYNEKVILLFFGDHQTNMRIDELDNDDENKYKVPYFIWSNFDIEKKEYGDTSTNYLQCIMEDVANLPKSEYSNYMLELRKEIPVITANYYIGSNGIKYKLNDKNSPYYTRILEYKNVVYYQMFDYEN